jgi:hypothetical protein
MIGMDKNKLVALLQEAGWKNIVSDSEFKGNQYDLVGERKFLMTQWNVLVRFWDRLDHKNIGKLNRIISELREESESWLIGQCFILVIVADTVDPKVGELFDENTLPVLRWKGGGGKVFLFDAKHKRVYGNIPQIPYDVYKYSSEIEHILYQFV